MRKYFLATIVSLFSLVLLAPVMVSANDVSVSDDMSVYLTGEDKTLTILAGSSFDSMVVNPNSIVFNLVNGSSVTVRSSDHLILNLSPAIANSSCKVNYSEITFSSYVSQSVTLTLGNTCSGGGGTSGGGSGGGGEAVAKAPVTATGIVTATAAGGKTTVTTGEGAKASVELPANAVNKNTNIKITPVSKATLAVTAPVPAGKGIPGGYVYQYSANVAETGGAEVTVFAKPVTLTFTYTDAQVANLDESTLKVYYWDTDSSEWVALPSTVDTVANKVTATTNHFTYFTLIGNLTGEEVAEKPITEMTVPELQAKIAELISLIAQVKAQIAQLTGAAVYKGVPAGFTFQTNLKQGMLSDDVRYLQIILNASSDTQVAASGVGSPGNETSYFGSLTKTAVVKFQEKYADEVLAPYGLTAGTGYVGSTTRAKLNELLTNSE